ncbi:MAG: tetratricopeptide repeat protein [Deltaproteobacteria bacterium]|nr:tetratricopeptide repeat protein [Deltaproteobacteria bacterium]
MDAARKFVDKGQIDKAVKEYLRIVREDPKDVRVWLKIGDLYAKKGSKQEASETYLKVARFYQEQGFYLKAVAVYKQILKLDPRLVEVNLKLAELYRQLGLLSDAMQHFELVAAHFHRDGKTKEALATVRQLVDLDPENVATRIKLAELYSKEAMTAEAVTEFTSVCETLRKQNRQDDFIKVAERLLWHKPENRELNRELASLYLRRNDPRRALQKLQICFKADPRDVETLGLLAQAFQALDQKSKTVSVLKELARVFDENKQRDKAEEVHRKILQFVPVDPESLAYLGDKAKAKLAPAVAAAAAATPPPSPRAPAKINFTGEVPALNPSMTGAMPLVDEKSLSNEFSLPEYAEEEPAADFAADMALEDDSYGPGESSAGEVHADEISKILTETDVYLKYGLHQKAVEHLRRVFALDPENTEAREKLKEVYLAQGREADAVAELMKLAEAMVDIDPDRAEGYLREILGIDGGHRAALEFARRHRLDLSNSGDVEVIDGGDDIELDPEELGSGQVAAVEDDIDFDDIDFGDASKPSFGQPRGESRADSFDGIDPAMFGSPPEGARVDLGVRPTRGAPPAAPLDLSRNRTRLGSEGEAFAPDQTRQVDPAKVRALAEMSGAPEPLEFEAGVVEGAGPPPASWARGGLDAAVAAQLDDSLADEIDDEVAAELSAVRGLPAKRADGVPQLDDDLDELPFDPAAARAFDAGVQRRRGDQDASVPTFDPAAAAAFDAERPYPTAPKPSSFGANALAADSFEPDDDFPQAGPALRRAPALADYADSGATEFVASPAGLLGNATQDAELDAIPEFGGATGELSGGTIDQAYDLDAADDGAMRIAEGGALEDDLDEADFYASQGMHAEAVAVLRRVLARHPRHPLVAAKLRDAEAALGGGGTIEGGGTSVGAALEALDAEDAIEEEALDAGDVDAAELDAALAADALEDEALDAADAILGEDAPEAYDDDGVAASGGTAALDLADVEEIDPDELSEPDPDVEEAFAAAPSGPVGRAKRPVVMLENPVEDSDADTHYDLGLAYKEMGLWDEAVKAFEKVAGAPGRAVQCRLMIGLCHRSAGNPSEAVHQFKIGLHEASVTDREKQSLFYEIGVAYEELGDPREALYYLEMVVKRDPSFLDANDRVQRLRATAGNNRRPRQASDDPDGAIDSLLADDT